MQININPPQFITFPNCICKCKLLNELNALLKLTVFVGRQIFPATFITKITITSNRIINNHAFRKVLRWRIKITILNYWISNALQRLIPFLRALFHANCPIQVFTNRCCEINERILFKPRVFPTNSICNFKPNYLLSGSIG